MAQERHNIIDENLECPKCGDPLSNKAHECSKIPPGDYVGDGGELGDEIVKVYYDNDFSTHPFFVKPDPDKKKKNKKKKSKKESNIRNGIEAHHLLTSLSVRVDEYAALIKMLGYSINHRKNGLLIPTFMQVACAYGVPLHNGGHGATFILKEDLVEDGEKREDIKKWEFSIPESKSMTAIFEGYDKMNEIAILNYEDRLNDIIDNTCEPFKEREICEVTPEEMFNVAKDFINAMDENSQLVFRRISTFSWTLVSDGLDYAPGGIGCCKCTSLKAKRKKIKDSLTNTKLPSVTDNVKNFWMRTLSDSIITDEIKDKTAICKAGANVEKHYKNENSAVHYSDEGHLTYYKERMNIEEFKEFKDKKK